MNGFDPASAKPISAWVIAIAVMKENTRLIRYSRLCARTLGTHTRAHGRSLANT